MTKSIASPRVSTPRSVLTSPRKGVPAMQIKAVTKPVSPKFSTTVRLQTRRPSRMAEPTKTEQQQECDEVRQWFIDAFSEKIRENPYLSSFNDHSHPKLTYDEFKFNVLSKNLVREFNSGRVKEGILDENNHVELPVIRQFLRVHKAMFELRLKENEVVLRAAPGASKVKYSSKNSTVLFKE